MSIAALKEKVKNSFADVKFMHDSHQPYQPEKNDDGTYTVPFSVHALANQDGENQDPRFAYIECGFEVLLLDCEYSDKGWAWKSPFSYKIALCNDCVAVKFHNEDSSIVSESEYEDGSYYGLMPSSDNKALGRDIVNMLINNTDQKTRINVFGAMLNNCPGPDADFS